MELARDPAWVRQALRELSEMRANTADERARTDVALAETKRARDALQDEFDSGRMAAEDFNSARSEIEARTRALLAQRARAGLAECERSNPTP
jgi:hypothetical protein